MALSKGATVDSFLVRFDFGRYELIPALTDPAAAAAGGAD